jgi:hypothetical protein
VTNYLDDGFFDVARDPVQIVADNNNMPSFKSVDLNWDLAGGENVITLGLIRAGGTGGCSFVVIMTFTPAS